MTIKIKHKRSAVKGKAPLPADLEYGEIAVNYEATDPALYVKDSADAIRKIGGDATEAVKGIVELATAAETTTGTDATRAVHPAGLKVELDKLKLWDRTGTTLSPATAGDTIQGPLVPTNGALGFRNAIINGMVNINQRGVTIAAAAVGSYGPDRWKKVDATNMTQVVEDLNFVPGMKYTLSWKGGTPQVLTAPATGHWTLPNIPITATEVQLEMGEVATPYERRSMALEDLMCKRYYLFRNGAVACSPKASGLLAALPGLDEMRAMPTVNLVNNTCYFYNGTTWTNGNLTSITAIAFGTTRYLDATGLAGQAGTPLAASINITLSAEL